MKYISRCDAQATKREIGHIQRELDKLKKREAELTTLFKRLYEDNVLGRISDEQFNFLSAEYVQEQRKVKDNISKLEERLEQLKTASQMRNGL